jgi:hypothetical protein
MPRVKRPALATYKMVGYSPNHPMPIHVVGFLKEGERYVTIGMSVDEARMAYEKLGEALQKANGTIDQG